MDAVRDDLHEDALVRQARARHARLAVVQRRLRVEQVRDLRQAGIRRLMDVRGLRTGVRRAGHDAQPLEIGDQVERARQLRRQRHHPDAGELPDHLHIGLHRRAAQAFAQLRALEVRVQEGRLHVRAQHGRAARLRSVHDGLDAAQGLVGFAWPRAHRRGHKRRHAGIQQRAAHPAHVVLAAHAVRAGKGVNVDVHKAGEHIASGCVADGLVRPCAQRADLSDASAFHTHIRFFQSAVHKRRSVLNQQWKRLRSHAALARLIRARARPARPPRDPPESRSRDGAEGWKPEPAG